jgi:hypothetical protein
MDRSTLINLLNSEKTTVTEVLNAIQKLLDQFHEKTINQHAIRLKKQHSKNKIEHFDLDSQADIIFKEVQNESVEFIETMHTDLTDTILDLINEGIVNKHSAFNFISILTTVRDLLKEQTNTDC